MLEIKFQKYKKRGKGYHWKQISRDILKRNIYVVARYEIVMNLIGKEIRNKTILDVGCGDGVLSWMLANRGAKVVGIDISKEAIAFAKERCKNIQGLKFVIASAYEIPFRNQSYDYVVCSEVAEHLSEPVRMISEIRRAWNEKGKIIISTPIKLTQRPLDRMHYKEFFEEEFEGLLKRYFKRVKIIKSHPLFWMEFQNKTFMKRIFNQLFLNVLNIIFDFNPFKKRTGWRYFTLQTAIISGK